MPKPPQYQALPDSAAAAVDAVAVAAVGPAVAVVAVPVVAAAGVELVSELGGLHDQLVQGSTRLETENFSKIIT